MSIIIPNQPATPKPGIQFEVMADGATVVLRLTATAQLTPDDAENYAEAIVKAATKAREFVLSIPVVGRNGGIHG